MTFTFAQETAVIVIVTMAGAIIGELRGMFVTWIAAFAVSAFWGWLRARRHAASRSVSRSVSRSEFEFERSERS